MSTFPEITGDSALCLFCATFGGSHEVENVAKVTNNITLLDIDREKLEDMLIAYPKFTAIIGDAFTFIENCKDQYDIVTCDQWTQMDNRVWDCYEKLRSMAKRYLIISVCQVYIDTHKLPEGDLILRSLWRGGVYWHVTKIGDR